MAGGMQTADHEGIVVHQHKVGQFFWVWGALLGLTVIEIYLGYQNMQPLRMLFILLGLSIIKSALIILYFMHMKFEIRSMRYVLMTALIVCLCLMTVFFADAARIISLGVR
ncbi:MAG: cytochrome C oxidase subunit IV family protein [Terriglobales bacterium]